ncbi:hypothetical protein DVH24_022162 [Malus domestica]|uniref:Pentatricopeptide repeat-containing protein n=1 Tax=Malus domestica TaxID=3750 RepID=A0A498IUA1_MALDO|nr:hypothetical protein DVH24_022162 [Malus domestica]
MVELVMENAQLGVSNFQSNGILSRIVPQSRFLHLGFRFFGDLFSVLYEKNVRKNRVFGINFVNSKTFISAVSKEGSVILEKEFEFKPSFDQYLKVMGTVRLRSDRDKQQKSKEENSKHNSRSRGVSTRLLSEGSGKDAKLGEPEGNLNREKASKVENRTMAKNAKGWSESCWYARRRSRSTMTQNAKDGPRVYKSMDNAIERRKFGVRNEDGVVTNHINAEKATDRGLVPRSVTKSGRDFPNRFNDNSLEVERAAFQSFDEFGDIMDKPRVSQMEIEQRIQKLAKWLNGADIDMPEWMFSKMMRSAQIRFTDHSILRVIQLLGKLGNWRREQMSSYPDLVAYHSIAVTLGQAGHKRALFDVIDTMRSPPKKKFKTGADPWLDLVVFHAVLNACVQRKQWEGVFCVLQQLKQPGLQPAATTYELVMELSMKQVDVSMWQVQLGSRVFQESAEDFYTKRFNLQRYVTISTGLVSHLIFRCRWIILTVVNTPWREGKIDEAVSVVHNMERRGIVGYAALYYDFARCLCSAGRCQEALMQYLFWFGTSACITVGSLIPPFLLVENAAYVFKQMENFCSPNLVTCNIMLKAYLDHGMFEKARDLFLKMLDDGNNTSSISDYKIRIIPDSYTFNTLFDTCVTEKRWDDFEYVYKRMLHHVFHFNAKRHPRMILDACKAGKVELLDVTWMHLTEADRIPPPPLVKGSSLSSETTRPPGGNETNLLPGRSVTPDSASVSNMLVVTSSVRMLDWVHSHTTNLGPAVPLHSELVVSITSLEHWLFCSSSSCNLPNHSTAPTWNNLLGSRRKFDPGLEPIQTHNC